MNNNRFILLTTHRSGTNLLLHCLNNAARITCHKQVFAQTVLFERFALDRLGSPFYRFRTASLKRQINYLFRKKQLVGQFMATLYAAAAGRHAVGVRLIYEQADKHPEILEWATENNVAIIHLIRKNALQTVAQTEASLKRGLVRSTSRAEPATTVHLSPARLKMQLTRLTQQIEKYRAGLENGRYLEVFYEALVANPEVETGRVLRFLNIEPDIPLTGTPANVEAALLFETLIENYSAVKQSLSGTAFEKFLNEQSCLAGQI